MKNKKKLDYKKFEKIIKILNNDDIDRKNFIKKIKLGRVD
jgi:hypothetical protein